uniref:Ymf101 n=1 Tax=Plasmopara halstedii TaxID=4781 RepID=UPI0020279871|nr:Ymf101 [Plasmopara halstedii]DAZ89077.1 TPA_asm: Ymf101 [Plasmopara halstedii]
MKKSKKFFNYKNKIILTNGSSLRIISIKYIQNYHLNFQIFKKKEIINDIISDKNKLNFIKKII